MVRHQAIGRADDAVGTAALRHQVAVKRIVAIFGEDRLPPVAALGDVMGQIRNDDP